MMSAAFIMVRALNFLIRHWLCLKETGEKFLGKYT